MAKEKPKKGGMVLIIGMGAKPSKSKSKVKKAEDDEKPKINVGRLRTRGNSGNVKADPKSSTGRFLNFRRMMRKDPNFLNETLKRQRIDKDYLERYLQHKHGVTFEEAMEKKLPIPQLMEDAAKIAASNRGNDPRKNKNLAGKLKREGIKPSAWIKHIEDNPFWEEEKSFNELIADLGGSAGGRTSGGSKRRDALAGERIRGIKQRERALEDEERMSDEDDRQGYTDRDLQTMTNILSASMPVDQARQMASSYLQTGRHIRTERTSPFGNRYLDKPKEGTGQGRFQGQGSIRHANNFLTQLATQRGYPGRTVGGSVAGAETAIFSPPRTVGVKLGSPQEEEEENAADYGESRKSSDNPMTLAWAILKGNPAMKDARGQNIDQPAAAMYDNLAQEMGNDDFGLTPKDKRKRAGRMTRRQMQESDPEDGRNYGVQRQDRHEVDHPNKPSRVKAIKEMLERNGSNPNFAMLEMARRLDEQRDFGDASQAPSQPTGTDVKMKPGNIMDQM